MTNERIEAFAAAFGLPTDRLDEALRDASSGQFERLKDFGVLRVYVRAGAVTLPARTFDPIPIAAIERSLSELTPGARVLVICLKDDGSAT